MTQTAAAARTALPDTLPSRKVPAVTRAVALLRLLADSPAPLPLRDLAREVGIIPSTCLGILRVLVAEGLVTLDPETKRYGLAAGMLTLARPLLREDGAGHLVQPALDRIAREHMLTATLVEVSGLRHFVVTAVSRAAGLRLQIDIGRRAPALISATGRCVAAFGGHDQAQLRAAFARLRWDNAPAWRQWCGQVDLARRRGYGVDENHYIGGMTAIAAPVFDVRGRLRHCVTAVGMSGQFSRAGVARIGRQLIAVATEATPPG